jgi:hypothetical protein
LSQDAGGFMRTTRFFHFLRTMMLPGVIACSCLAVAQQARSEAEDLNTVSDAIRSLQEQVRQLQVAVASMRAENQQARAESAELRAHVEQLRRGANPSVSVAAAIPASAGPSAALLQEDEPRAQSRQPGASLEEEYDLLSGKVDDQYQTKVESASKYRMRLSGIVLMNLFANNGRVDSIDVPTLAYGTVDSYLSGSVGATLRQSEIGFEVFGPRVAGAKTRAALQLDFGGGFEPEQNGVNAGIVRLRTGTMRLDWEHTSIVAGQDGLFFSPLSPTSFASLTVPALSYAGNLWGWIPQVRVEHRMSLGEQSGLTFQAGILDPVSGETPLQRSYRIPGPGENSRTPAFGGRAAWSHTLFGQPLRWGWGGFYSRQDYGFDRTVDGWAGMTDVELPLSHRFFLSGKLYRGKGLGGLYGGIGRSAVFSGDPADPNTMIRGLNSAGGWAQLKYQATNKLELNTAFGLDNSYARDLRAFPNPQAYGSAALAKNLGALANVIFRPRSDLLFSAEYRHLKTYNIDYGPSNADHVNLMMGVLF